MAEKDELKPGLTPKEEGGVVQVPMKLLTQMQEQMAEMERKIAEGDAKREGLEALAESLTEANGEKKEGLRKQKTFEPKFRTLRLRKYPIAGDYENKGFVIGWTNRGAYQVVDRSGIAPVIVDMLDVVFLGQERGKDGKLKAEQIKLLDLMNNGEFVHCKILENKKVVKEVPTNEEINVSVFDPQHGLIATGETVDGYFTYDEIKYLIQIPGIADPVWIDSTYANI